MALTESQIAERVAAQFADNHAPLRDQDKPVQDVEEVVEAEVEENAEPEVEEVPGQSAYDDAEAKEQIAGYMRDKDYRKKTMAISERQRALDAREAALSAKLEAMARLEEIAQANPQFGAEIATLVDRYENQTEGGAQASPALMRQIRALEGKLNQTLQERQVEKEDRFVARVKEEQEALAEKFDIEVNDVISITKSLIESGELDYNTPLTRINRLIGGEIALRRYPAAKADGQRDAVKKLTQARRAPSVKPQGTPIPPKEPDVTKMTDRQFREFMKEKAREAG